MQSTIFPVRNGLQVPRGENLQAVEILSEGGLDLTQSVIGIHYGCASALTNFEVSLQGGYRRVNGYWYYSRTAVPGTGPVIGVSVYYPGTVLAARQDTATTYSIYSNAGTSWTKLNTSSLTYTSGMILQSYPYNWTGTHKLVITDGVNPAYTWDGTTMVKLNASGSAANPTVACVFNGYLFVSGYSSNFGAVKVSAPLNEADWAPVDGAAEFVVGDAVVALKIWRDQLIIFCNRSIHKLVGNSTDPASSTPFTLQPITTKLGCVEGRTVKECDGDLIFLSQDGIRTISGTFNIGDTEIGSISRPIQAIASGINSIQTILNAVVVHKKTQYRLFIDDVTGIIGSVRRFRDGHEAWEWGQLSSFHVACADSGYMIDGKEYVIHGATDGYVYRQEIGNTLKGDPIGESYITVPFDLGDRGLRKAIHRITLYLTFEGAAQNAQLALTYDYNRAGVLQPEPYAVFSSAGPTYDNLHSTYDHVSFPIAGIPLIRQNVQGSGFILQLGLSSLGTSAPYTIQGYYIEYYPASRR